MPGEKNLTGSPGVGGDRVRKKKTKVFSRMQGRERGEKNMYKNSHKRTKTTEKFSFGRDVALN